MIKVQQDTSRAFANPCSNEQARHALYKQGTLMALVKLSESEIDAMGLRFLASDPEMRVMIVHDNKIEPFVVLARSPLLEYRRTSALSLASFSLHESNKSLMVRSGCIDALLGLATDPGLAIRRDAVSSLSE